MLERNSAIAAGLARAPRNPNDQSGCRLGEMRGWSLLQVAGFRGSFGAAERAIATCCGVAVPATIGPVARAGGLLIMRTGPEQIWLIGPGDTLAEEPALRSVIVPGIGVLTPLSHSRTRIFIDGPRARNVLAKGIAIDLAADRFAVDHVAMTGLDHTPILLHRAASNRYELWAMRTFALSLWEWLTDAAQEFGADVVP